MVPCGQNMSPDHVPTHRTVLTGHYYSRFMSRFSTPCKLPGCEVSSQFSQQYSPQIPVRVINRARQMESQPLAITCNKTRIFCNKLWLIERSINIYTSLNRSQMSGFLCVRYSGEAALAPVVSRHHCNEQNEAAQLRLKMTKRRARQVQRKFILFYKYFMPLMLFIARTPSRDSNSCQNTPRKKFFDRTSSCFIN